MAFHFIVVVATNVVLVLVVVGLSLTYHRTDVGYRRDVPPGEVPTVPSGALILASKSQWGQPTQAWDCNTFGCLTTSSSF